MSEDRATRWRRMSREQRERLMSAVAAIQDKRLDDLAGEVLAEVLSPDNEILLHPQDRRALSAEQARRRRGGGTTWLKNT